MRCLTFLVATALLLHCCVAAWAAGREPVPLNDYARLGQRFTVERPFTGIWVSVPSWSDAEGGLTLTLWDSPERTRQLAQKVVKDVADNARVELLVAKALPAGAYYWEIHERTGQTRIGLWSDLLDTETEDCAYLDGKPDRKRHFVSGAVGAPFVYRTVPQLLGMLKSGKAEDRIEACRQLAVVGTPEAVPALAGLLADEKLSHMARLALERMPGAAADAVFRGALAKLRGKPLVGAINSIAVRQDAKAVVPLSKLLQDANAEVASAAAVALGRIGTPSAAAALEKTLAMAAPALRPALYEGSLECARVLAVGGKADLAAAVYDRLGRPEMPAAIRASAMRGAIVTRGAGGLPLLLEQLRGADPAMAGVALWVAQRELPGEKVTQALAAGLGGLPAERQPLLLQALAMRGDRAALPALLDAATAGAKPIRLAALGALSRLEGVLAVPALVKALSDADPEVSQAAQGGLASMPGAEVAAAVAALLASAESGTQLAGIALARKQRLRPCVPALLRAGGGGSPEVRLAALQALRELSGPDDLPALLDLLVNAREAKDMEAAEQALASVCAKAGEPDTCADKVVGRLAQAGSPQKVALIRVLAAAGGAKALQAVRDALANADAESKAAALEALCEWKTPDAAPDLLQLARGAEASADRLRGLRGCLRMAGDADLPAEQRLSLCKDAAEVVQRDEERKLLLGALGGLAAPDALALVVPHLDSAATKEEACVAAVAIAAKLVAGPDAAKAIPALEKVAQVSGNPDLVKRAQALRQQVK